MPTADQQMTPVGSVMAPECGRHLTTSAASITSGQSLLNATTVPSSRVAWLRLASAMNRLPSPSRNREATAFAQKR